MPPKPKPQAKGEEGQKPAPPAQSVHSKRSSSAMRSQAQAQSPSKSSDSHDHPGGSVASAKAQMVKPAGGKEDPSQQSAAAATGSKGHADETDENDTTPKRPTDAHVRGTDVKWFKDRSYLTPFLMHLRRNTVLARSKRDTHLEECPAERREHSVYPGYYNYDEFPMLGVDSAEMKKEVNDKRDAAKIPPKLIILIGGAAVGKSYTIQQMFPNNNATHIDVDEPKMYADAMHQLMPEPASKERWKTGPGNGINQRNFLYYVIDKLIQNRDDIIIDTTGSMKRMIHYCMAQAIEHRESLLPYTVICIAVFAPIELALSRCAHRGATTLRDSGRGMVFGTHHPVSGIIDGINNPSRSLLQHYAVKEKFIKKTALFFLLDNTPGGVIATAPDAGRGVIDGIPIPAETVLCFKYTNHPSSDVVTTRLVYISKSVDPGMSYYGCHVHQPSPDSGASKASKESKESKESKAGEASKESKAGEASKEGKAGKAGKESKAGEASKAGKAGEASKAGEADDMIIVRPGDILRCRPNEGGGRRTRKSNKNKKQTKRKNNRGYHKIKNTHRYRRRRTLKF